MNVFPDDPRVIVPIADILQGRVDKIKFKPGFNAKSVVSDGGTTRVYSAVLFRLMELMIMDVIAGDIVYLDKKRKAMFYVDYMPVAASMIEGTSIKENMKIPLVNLRLTNYKMPIIAFDPGYKYSTPCICRIPLYLYVMLIEEVNKGRKYPKSVKDFRANKM